MTVRRPNKPARTKKRTRHPDYARWARHKHLSVLQATCLSLDDDPDEFGSRHNVSGRSLEDALEFPEFRERYYLIENLIGDKKGIKLGKLLEWMEKVGLTPPTGLKDSLALLGTRANDAPADLADALREIEQLKHQLDKAQQQRDALKLAISHKGLKSLDRIVVGIAMAKYGWVPSLPRGNKYAEKIAADMLEIASDHQNDGPWRQDLKADADTVRKHLHAAYRRLDSEREHD